MTPHQVQNTLNFLKRVKIRGEESSEWLECFQAVANLLAPPPPQEPPAKSGKPS